jgi:hypothetical protein
MEEALYWLAGAIGVPLVQWLKEVIGAQGKSAVWLTVAVAVILSIAALFLSQELALSDFTLPNLVAVFGQVLAAATLAYKLLMPDVS